MGSLFRDMLDSNESVFKNLDALDFEFLPKLLPYRENQQHFIATSIKPLLQGRNGRNLFICGAPGIGKTAAIKWVLRDLEDETDDVVPIYINCWQKNTSYKIIVEICERIGYKFTQNKKTEELFKIVKDRLNKTAVVFAFDEVDKLEDFAFIYTILEEIYKKSVLLITNYKDWLANLDQRVRSRLTPELMEFRQYSREETAGILKDRTKYAFVPGVWEKDAFDLVAEKTADMKDIRAGLFMMKEAGMAAEDASSKKIGLGHAKAAAEKVPKFEIKDSEELDEEAKAVLEIVKDNSGKKIGELYKIYEDKGGKATYKTFQRKIEKLSKNKFISAEKTAGGKEGNTTIVSYEKTKKITDF
jgi:cell division control protein 6